MEIYSNNSKQASGIIITTAPINTSATVPKAAINTSYMEFEESIEIEQVNDTGKR